MNTTSETPGGKIFVLSSFAGLGDRIIGISSIEIIARKLGSLFPWYKIYIDMPMFHSNPLVTLKEEYRLPEGEDWKKGKTTKRIDIVNDNNNPYISQLFQNPELWNEDIIYLHCNLFILDHLQGNKINSGTEDFKTETRDAIHRFFYKYMVVDPAVFNDIKKLYNADLPHVKETKGLASGIPYMKEYICIHFRHGDDKYILNNTRSHEWPQELKRDLDKMFQAVALKIHKNNSQKSDRKILLLSDLHCQDIHEIAYKFINKNRFFKIPDVKVIHCDRTSPSYDEWLKVFSDFFAIAGSTESYISPNSNFSRAAVIMGNSKVNFVYKSGAVVKPTDIQLLKKTSNEYV